VQLLHLVSQKIVSPPENEIDCQFFAVAHHVEDITLLREQYRCPHFRILVIGRANAGKTTILEKVCGVEKGTKPIIVYDKKGKLDESPMYSLSFLSLLGKRLTPCETHLIPSIEVSH
jgi:ABC-type uncharacterized transport system ATPase subunit